MAIVRYGAPSRVGRCLGIADRRTSEEVDLAQCAAWLFVAKETAYCGGVAPSLSAIARFVLNRLPVFLGADITTVGEFTINVEDAIPFVLSYLPSHLPLGDQLDPTTALTQTETFWRDWSARRRPAGPFARCR
jgi:hypothetical protein